MILYHEDAERKYIEIKVSGHVTKEDFAEAVEKIKPRMMHWRNIRILEIVENLEGVDGEALIQDLRFAMKNLGLFKHFEKCAVVADEKWLRALSRAADPLLRAEVRAFRPDQLAEAREWLLAGDSPVALH
ncbi:MAG: STAS/SEC14 domain-containing protein [Bdellovibrionaceae bacterium]|nr:STAS/SEC14 domain-containing protein [Pseudobdellovibrionaceae bacterium]